MVCKKLFNMDIPKEVYDRKLEKSKYIDVLIDDIFSSGVYGKKDKGALFARELAYTDENSSVLNSYLHFLDNVHHNPQLNHQSYVLFLYVPH